ncbi:MAG: helix-turn-helix domain-containing protein [Bdellovibrionales bacterium]|nr:helix-turn-helix domain-containing protein [Bdellovibrionales bacterium]
MKETGNTLKNARLKQNISLEEVAQATKIKVQTIVALEDGDLEKLPKKAFIRGFVRTYAGFLKLNVNELLDTFHKEMGSTQKQSLLQSNDSLSDDPAVQFANSKRNPFTRGVFVVVIAAIVIVIYMTSRVIQK